GISVKDHSMQAVGQAVGQASGQASSGSAVPVAPAPPAPVVVLAGVTRRFPGVIANDKVSARIYPGEVHVLLGENGAGKSTLVAMLSGLQQPDEGHIEIGGTRVTVTSPRHALSLGIGTVFQH